MTHDSAQFALETLSHLLLALAVGASVMVLLAAMTERFILRAALRRALWQAVTVGLVLLLFFEWTGSGHALSTLVANAFSPEPAAKARRENRVAVHSVRGRPFAERTATIHRSRSSGSSQDATPAADLLALPPTESRPSEIAERPSLTDSLAWDTPQVVELPRPIQPQVASDGHPRTSLQTGKHEATDAPPAALPPAPSRGLSRTQVMSDRLVVPGLLLLWAGGAFFFVGRAVLARGRLYLARRRWTPCETPDLHQMVAELGRRIGTQRRVRICQAPGLPAPVAFGFWRPTILLPADFLERFSQQQQKVILVHELTHLAAWDPVWLLGSEVALALMWWHPLVHLARHRLLAATEQAADEASVVVPDGPDVLADCLVQLGRRITARPRFGWIGAEGSGLRSGLARRVQRLLSLGDREGMAIRKRATGTFKPMAFVSLVVLGISSTLWIHPKATHAKGESTMNVMRASWRGSLAAATLAAFLSPMSDDAVADNGPEGPPKPAQLEEGSPVDQVLLAQREDPDRREREEREMRGRRERDEREMLERERDEHRERLQREREELHHRAEEIEREKAELHERGEGGARELEEAIRKTHEEREEVERHIAEMEERIGDLRRELEEEADDDDSEEDESEDEEELEELEEEIEELSKELDRARDVRAESENRARQLSRELDEHRENVRGRMEELEQGFREIRERLGRIGAEFEGVGRERPRDRDREHSEGMERMERMEREIGELRRAGRHDEAERLGAEFESLRRRLAGPRDPQRREAPPELRAKLDHLHAAMENLHAAGLHEQAEQIGEQIERLRREHPPERGDRERQPERERGPRPEGDVIGQLRGQIDRLRQENEEIRRMMKELREGQERLMKELRERR